jgi:DNA replication licensing factor MCM4
MQLVGAMFFFLDHIMRNVFFKASNIFGHEDIKKGLLLQLFGGTKKSFMNAEQKRFRSQINILLCGDPCTAKSQLQQYIFHLIPHAQYINGKDTSAAGLSAAVIKDSETDQFLLQM